MKYKIGDKFLNELEISEINQEKAAPYFLSGGQGVGWWSEAALMDLRKYITGGWIPVEEQLPENEEMVLVSCTTKKGINSVNRAYYNGTWHGSGSMSGVVAWMPLPEPYRPKNLAYADNDTAQPGLLSAT